MNNHYKKLNIKKRKLLELQITQTQHHLSILVKKCLCSTTLQNGKIFMKCVQNIGYFRCVNNHYVQFELLVASDILLILFNCRALTVTRFIVKSIKKNRKSPLSSWCLVMVEQLFLVVPRGCLQFVIVVFPDHTHLLFFINSLFVNIF